MIYINTNCDKTQSFHLYTFVDVDVNSPVDDDKVTSVDVASNGGNYSGNLFLDNINRGILKVYMKYSNYY